MYVSTPRTGPAAGAALQCRMQLAIATSLTLLLVVSLSAHLPRSVCIHLPIISAASGSMLALLLDPAAAAP